MRALRALPLIVESSINITFKGGDIAIWRLKKYSSINRIDFGD